MVTYTFTVPNKLSSCLEFLGEIQISHELPDGIRVGIIQQKDFLRKKLNFFLKNIISLVNYN